MKKHIFLFLFTALMVSAKAQHFNLYTAHWYFAKNCAVDFSSYSSIVDTNSAIKFVSSNLSAEIRYSTISDEQGNLLFYTDGYFVYNRFHQQMPNGFGLKGGDINQYGDTGYHSNSHIIFRMPNNNNQYIHIVQAIEPDRKVYYSIIDLTLDSGKGDVLTKNMVLMDSASYHLGVVKHTNGNCYWVVLHGYKNNKFYAFPFCGGGDTIQPVISTIGINYNYDYGNNYYIRSHGYMKFSPNGRKLAVWNHKIDQYNDTIFQLFSFDAQTGIISNPISISVNQYYENGNCFEFSQNSSIFYYTNYNPGASYIYQYNLLAGSPTDIINSKVFITIPAFSYQRKFQGMQLGIDGKIYLSKTENYSYSHYLGVIHNPDSFMPACSYADSGFFMGTTMTGSWMPQQWIVPSFLQKPMDFEHIGACVGDTVRFSLSDSVYTVLWDFGDTANPTSNGSTLYKPTHVYSQPGSYLVEAACLHYGMHDTVRKVVDIYPLTQVSLGPDVKIDSVSSVTLDAGSGYGGYLWSTGDTSQTLTVNGSGMATGVYPYSIMVTDSGVCPGYDTVLVYVNTWVGLQEPNPVQSWEVFPNPAKERLMVQIGANWSGCEAAIYNAQGQVVHNQILQNSTTSISLVNLSSGVYYLRLSNDKRSEVKRFEIMR